MTSARYSRRVVLALLVGVAGAIIGALSAYDGDAALKVIMALIGFSFGTSVGVFLIAVVSIVLRSSHLKSSRHALPEHSPEPLRDEDPFEPYFPGNPDPLSRQVTGWRLPSDRR